jgi:H+/Cl- antiporter ClcA
METTNLYGTYLFHEMPMRDYLYVVVAGVVCGLCGVGFYKLCMQMRKWFRKISFKNPKISHGIRIAFAVFLGGLVSFTAAGVMGGGQSLIRSLGTMGGAVEPAAQSSFGESLFWTLLIILCLKFLITTINVGAGIPCGIFVPIIAIGACLGALMNQGWVALGMDEKYCDIMIMICMAAFFTTIVKAPITAIIMICEFTGSFAPLLPVIIAVSIGYVIGEMSKTDGIYDDLLEMYEHEEGIHAHSVREVYTLVVESGSLADRREVRDILWPVGARVKELRRGEEVILPDGQTILRGGDRLTIVCLTSEPNKTRNELEHILA